MKVILYVATTINGMLAAKDNRTPWSNEELKSFFENVQKAGNVIVGRKTLPLFFETDLADMGNPLVIVLTKDSSLKDKENVRFVNSPKVALEVLEKAGFESALITGGGETNGAFLKENLIDEIYLDVEPFIFGGGIPLFSPSEVELNLELIDQKMINKNTVQLHYKVIK
jgi:dihydrofolate reductase